jgi:hypothetical protein
MQPLSRWVDKDMLFLAKWLTRNVSDGRSANMVTRSFALRAGTRILSFYQSEGETGSPLFYQDGRLEIRLLDRLGQKSAPLAEGGDGATCPCERRGSLKYATLGRWVRLGTCLFDR